MGTKVDYTGRKVASLEMIEYSGNSGKFRMWKCLCDCGEVVIRRGARVASGEQKTCGKCLPHLLIKDLDVFGRWTVTGKETVNQKPKFLLSCVCGEVGSAYASSLINGDTTMCRKCSWSSSYPHLDMAEPARVLKYLKATANRRGISFDLTESDVSSMCFSPCNYCGGGPSSKVGNAKYQGIDRVNSSKGYFLVNVVPCCKLCNRAKSSLPEDVWLEWVERLVGYQCGMKVERS